MILKPRQLFICVLIVCSLSACVSIQEIAYSYPQNEMEPYLKSGSAKVFGQAFLRQRGGDVVVCAGEPVMLIPNIGVFAEAYRLRKQGVVAKVRNSASGRVSDAGLADPVARQAIRQTICDAQGNFELSGLPAGNWLLYSRVQWVAGEYSLQQGSDLIEIVTTSNSGEQRVLLTDQNRV